MPAGAPRSLFEVLARLAGESGHAVASLDDIHRGSGRLSARLTYRELHDAAVLLAGAIGSCLEASTGGAVVATRMRRGNEWYAVFFAAAKLQVPLVSLSVDLPDKAVENSRNAEILSEHRPVLLITDDSDPDGALTATRSLAISELWGLAEKCAARALVVDDVESQRPRTAGAAPSPDATLCFCYTGGTTEASRCVRVTHGMALFEVDSYPRVARLTSADRVLQQHSLYWGASAYGEVDIALAFGCALIFCEAWGIDGVMAAIVRNQATCAGLVPSILASIDPVEVPSLRLVFTWGEALQAKVANEWAKRMHLVDLLISTECWLSLYADWTEHARLAAKGVGDSCSGSPEFRTVPGTQVRIQTLEDRGTADGAGELLVAGPMVMPGYTDAGRNKAVLVEDGGISWYCTRDCVAPRGQGFVFSGRADDLVKVGGVWVDVREVERELAAASGVAEVRILQRTAFVVLSVLREGAVPQLRRALPPDFRLFVVPSLPRRAGTDKVDRKRLMDLVKHGLEVNLEQLDLARCERELVRLWKWYRMFMFLAVACLLHAGAPTRSSSARLARPRLLPRPRPARARNWPDLPSSRGWQRAMPRAASSAMRTGSTRACRTDARSAPPGAMRPRGARGAAAGIMNIHDAEDVLPAPPAGIRATRLALLSILECVWRLFCFTYLQLIFCLNCWPRFCKTVNRCCHYVPFGLQGALIFLVGALPRLALLVAAAPGALMALRRGRLLAWPLVCLLGFPVWARDSGAWWAGKGAYGVLRWYGRIAQRRLAACCAPTGALARRAARAFSEAPSRLLVQWRRGATMECQACHKSFASSEGRVDPAVDDNWYCEGCWQYYHRHRLCSGCNDWCTRGRADPETGKWTCNSCRRASGESQGAAGGDATRGPGPRSSAEDLTEPLLGAAAGRGPASAGASNGGAGRQNGSARPSVQKRELALDLPEQIQQSERAASGGAAEPPHADGGSPAAGGGHREGTDAEARAPPLEPKSAEWLLVERASGWTFASPGDSLASLDSLRTAKIASALLREAGVRLPRQALRQCATLGDLVAEIVNAQGRLCERAEGHKPIVEERAIWGLMWNSKCQWTLRRDRPLEEAVLRAALAKLIDRHPALRVRLADPMRLFDATQKAFSVLEMWRGHRRRVRRSEPTMRGPLQRLAARLADCALGAVQWSFRRAWPRVGAAPSRSLPLHVMPHAADLDGAKRALCWTPQFEPPLQVSLAPFDEGALVRFAVTHMTSDGYCLMPLLADLAHFVAQEEAAAGGGPVPAPLPPLPSALAVTESRITRAINGHSASNDAPTLDPITKHRAWSRESVTVLTHIPPEVVAGIRHTASLLAVSDDIVMLAAVGATLARFDETWVTPITMVVPQRDGPGESDMVGLFADIRIISVRTEGLSLAGLVMWLHHVVNERLWQPPPTETQGEVPLVNFEWTDFDSRHGFTQFVQCRDSAEHLQNPLKVAVDQPDRLSWRVRMSFDTALHGQERRDQFFALFQQNIRNLLLDPLQLIWSDAAA